MSAIDNSKHLRIGMLLGIPIYQLLEDNHSLGHRNPQDKHEIPRHLILPTVPRGAIVIGGGSGEHPAIALYDPVHCVARYLQYCLEFQPSKIGGDLAAACANMQGDLQTIEYCNWTSQNHLSFRERCAGVYATYQEDMTFEAWLLVVIGEFLFHVVPGFHPRVQTWHGTYVSEAIHRFQIVSIPYETAPYGGNGRDRFRIVDTEAEAAPNSEGAKRLAGSDTAGTPQPVT
jgi:hypothetical protein